jgi:hypothetical protein
MFFFTCLTTEDEGNWRTIAMRKLINIIINVYYYTRVYILTDDLTYYGKETVG